MRRKIKYHLLPRIHMYSWKQKGNQWGGRKIRSKHNDTYGWKCHTETHYCACQLDIIKAPSLTRMVKWMRWPCSCFSSQAGVPVFWDSSVLRLAGWRWALLLRSVWAWVMSQNLSVCGRTWGKSTRLLFPRLSRWCPAFLAYPELGNGFFFFHKLCKSLGLLVVSPVLSPCAFSLHQMMSFLWSNLELTLFTSPRAEITYLTITCYLVDRSSFTRAQKPLRKICLIPCHCSLNLLAQNLWTAEHSFFSLKTSPVCQRPACPVLLSHFCDRKSSVSETSVPRPTSSLLRQSSWESNLRKEGNILVHSALCPECMAMTMKRLVTLSKVRKQQEMEISFQLASCFVLFFFFFLIRSGISIP